MAEIPYLDAPLGPCREAWFRPMGLSLRLVTDSAEVLAAAEAAFGGFGPGTPSEPADATFRLFMHPVDDEGPDGRPLLRVDGHFVYQTTGCGSTMVIDKADGTAFGYFSPATLAAPAFFRWHFLDLALFFMLEKHGFVGVHGAALARAGRGLVLRAPSGRGKSTLAYAGARRRFKALAEDMVWIAPGGTVLWGMPQPFHLLPDAVGLFPELAGETCCHQVNGEQKIAVDLERRYPGSTASSAAPAAVILLQRTAGGVSRLAPVEPDEAWREWLAGGASRESQVPGYERLARDFLARLPVLRLTVGDDLEGALDLLEPLLPMEAR